jgi:hypothetical protein
MSKIETWNNALIELGDRRLTDTGEPGDASEALSAVYDSTVRDCLEEASWNFAMTSLVFNGDTGIAITDTGGDIYGFRYGFAKPAGWMRTHAVSADEYFTAPLTSFEDELGIWRADTTPIYVRFTDTGPGIEPANWTRRFSRFVELELAVRAGPRINQMSAANRDALEKRRDRAKSMAKSADSMDGPQPKFRPEGSWNSSRSMSGSGERGNRHKFTG